MYTEMLRHGALRQAECVSNSNPNPNPNPKPNPNPNPNQVCDDSEPFGCRRYAAAGTPEGGDAVMAARAFKDRLM